MKWSLFSCGMALCCVLFTAGCDVPLPTEVEPRGSMVQTVQEPAGIQQNIVPNKAPGNLIVASFNIQVFGVSKAQDEWVMQRLAAVIRLFDVVAVQEIRSQDDRVMQQLINYVNAEGLQYSYVISERLGRTVSKEQYAYIFDTKRVVTNQNATYIVGDGDLNGQKGNPDLLHREPFVARFITTDSGNPFRFTLIDTHTDPDLAESEVNVLASVYQNVRSFELATGNEDDVMLLGDFNEPPSKFGQLATIPGLQPAIFDQPTNTAETKLFDNIMIDKYNTVEFTGRSGVLRMRDLFGMPLSDAKRLSDHNPVWAEFSSQESANATAAASDSTLRR